MNPRAYGVQFEMYAGTSGFAFVQNHRDGGQPIAIFSSLDQSIEFFGDCDIPNHCNTTEIKIQHLEIVTSVTISITRK